jgi:hypothetical protein
VGRHAEHRAGGRFRSVAAPVQWLRMLGVGGAHFTLHVSSAPQGATIAIDGQWIDARTPASLDVAAGRHRITLSLPELGLASFPIAGKRGEIVPLRPISSAASSCSRRT